MAFKVMTQDEQDDLVVQTLLAQERDLFCHELNRDRYTEMLKTLEPGPFRDRVTHLRDEAAERMTEVAAIIAAIDKQLPAAERLQAAATRIKTRESAGSEASAR